MGVFALQTVPSGAAVWAFDTEQCTAFTEKTIGEVEEDKLRDLLWKGFMTRDMDKVGWEVEEAESSV